MSRLLQPYPVFKSGAVLKHSDLNAIVTYLESQIQASRKYLDGFGILEGLELSYTTAAGVTTLHIAPGVAVLPDGQLVELTKASSFKYTRPVKIDSKEGEALAVCFRPDVVELTNNSGGTHTPLSADETRCILVYVKKDETGSTEPTSSCVRQSDLNEYRTPELQLRFFLGTRLPSVHEKPRECFSSLCLPLLRGEEITHLTFPEILYKALPKVAWEVTDAYEQVKNCFPDLFCDGDFKGLTGLVYRIEKEPEYVFYAYDYLKTLIAAYREFTQLPYLKGPYSKAAQDRCPQILSLGEGGKHCGCRQYWHPARERADERAEAVFYARRMVLLAEFDPRPIEQTPVHLTPSSSDRFPLSRRAIPFYINPRVLSRWWNYSLSAQNLENTIPHYGIDFCKRFLCYAEGSDFIRVEGHIGMPLHTALKSIENCRKDLNLPFSIIALEINRDDTTVLPLWQPHFDDLERSFQSQRSYFLAAMDLFYNLNPRDKGAIRPLMEMAEHYTCYERFNYPGFIMAIQSAVASVTYLNIPELAAMPTFSNAFDGLKIIWRSKQARLRQLFLHRFLQCQKGFDLMCGVPRGGTLAILYRRVKKDSGVIQLQEEALKAEREKEEALKAEREKEEALKMELEKYMILKAEREKEAALLSDIERDIILKAEQEKEAILRNEMEKYVILKAEREKEAILKSKQNDDIIQDIESIIPQGIVIGDLAIPCCDIDLTRTPVSVFSVSMRPEIQLLDGPAKEYKDTYPGDGVKVLGMTVTLRNLSLHYEGHQWSIELLEKGVVRKDVTGMWNAGGCDNMVQIFRWEGHPRTFKEVFFRATLKVDKDGKTDVYSEDFSVLLPSQKPSNGGEEALAGKRTLVAKTATADTTDAAKGKAPDLQTLLKQRHHAYKAFTSLMEKDKVINNNKAFNIVKSFMFFPKTKAALHAQFAESHKELTREIGETKSAERLEKYKELLQTATYLYLDRLVHEEEQVTREIRQEVRTVRSFLEEKGLSAADFKTQWETQDKKKLPGNDPGVRQILRLLDT